MQLGTFKQTYNNAVSKLESAAQRTKLQSMPVDVDIVLTKACNLACTFCRDYETEGAQRVSLENLEKVGRQIFPTASRLNICSGGEPYLHKGLEDLLTLAKSYGIYTWVLSNGMLMKPDRVRNIVKRGLIDLHGFSVDGYKDATVEAIRVRAKLPVILENIRQLIRIREEENQKAPRIVVRYALMRNNVEELPDAVERWGQMGIDVMNCGYLAIANGIEHQESLYFHQDLTERVFAEARRVAAKYPKLEVNLPGLIRDELKKKENPSPCLAPWRFVFIDTNGYILPCYRAFEGLSMGKVYDEDGVDFSEIWNSPDYRQLRATVNNDGAEKFYKYCGRCEFRYGWGDLAPHLGDETWVEALSEQKNGELVQINHRRK